ncbi:hypothetical protein Ahy_A06g029142 [Arachis hypogaea]|uniref:Peptidase A1 domain-containing protein n=1 Tax=Arachis hypogaea TaxID=3818 RepID=A0A445CSF4_ARAHY|nr:hypothetical protein Ahy_A06g029142 [Arachis hypogaea]
MTAVERRMALHRAQQVKKSRHGPRSRNSEYSGVTFYQSIGQCESHIWLIITSLLMSGLMHYLTNLVVAVSEDDDIICNKYNMLDQYFVKESVFSFWLNRNPEEENGSELIFGGVDPNHYKEKHTYVPVSRKGYWEFDMEDILIGDKKIGICADSCSAIVNLGTSLLAGPTNLGRLMKGR